MMPPVDSTPHAALKQQVSALQLHGILAHWDELSDDALGHLAQWTAWETQERHHRGLQRRLRDARIGRFKPLADFDWDWPTQCDRAAVTGLMNLNFIAEASNIILVGPNGVGKSMIAQNLTHQAVLHGHSALFVNAAHMLGDLAAQESDNALRRRFAYYARPTVLTIDEIGYLSYGNRHADLLFEIINRRYELKPTLISTNRPFGEWSEVFPNAACVVSIVDRLVHHAEIIVIDGESYRMREARERAARRAPASPKSRRTSQTPASGGTPT